MSDRIRQGLAFVIAMGMVIAVASAPTVAQVADPGAERVFEAAGFNADSVDGQHATKYTTTRGKRAGKLVATNSNGYLPSNILKPQWRVIQNMPAGFADGKDDRGVISAVVWTVNESFVIQPNATGSKEARCPTDSQIVGGGFSQPSFDVRVTDSRPNGTGWLVWVKNLGTADRTVAVWATCLITTPSSAIASKGSVQVAKKKK